MVEHSPDKGATQDRYLYGLPNDKNYTFLVDVIIMFRYNCYIESNTAKRDREMKVKVKFLSKDQIKGLDIKENEVVGVIYNSFTGDVHELKVGELEEVKEYISKEFIVEK